MNGGYLALSKKYARAFISLFSSILTLDELDRAKRLSDFIKERKEALFYIQISVLDSNAVKEAFFKLLNQFKLNEAFIQLINILELHRRLFLLPMILNSIVTISKDRANIAEFIIESSHSLSESQIKILTDFLVEATGKKIIYSTKINRELIAGVKIYSDRFGWEHSVQKQLEMVSRKR